MTGSCIEPDTAASYAAHALSAEEASRVERHIDTCERCRVLISTIAATAHSVGPVGASAELADVVLRRGTRVGPYELLAPLEAGGMGIVYTALDARLDRRVALKSVRRQGERAQLLREAKLMAQLAHPNVVPVYDVVDAGQLFVAMELVVGQSLRQWRDAAPRRWSQVVDAFLEAGEGLAAAHAAGIVHGDVKPSNILVGDDGRVRVTDFGLASLEAERGPTELLRGTPGYVALEQLTGAGHDARADQYSFCVSLHETLFGAFPGQPPLKRPQVPRRLARVLERGLSTDPAARFPSMRELLRALRRVRSARARWLAGATVVLLASVGVAWLGGARSLERQQCALAAASLASPWNEDSRGQLEHSFGATKVSWAPEVFGRVKSRLDAWAAQFDAARRDACTPTFFGPRVPAPELQARLECLAEAARQARGVISQLREPDVSIQLNAVAATEALVIDCRPTAPSLPRPVAQTPEVEALRDDLARFNALVSAGRVKQALELARTLAGRAEATGEERLRVAALVALGIAQERTSDFPAAVTSLRDAARRADVLQDDRLRAQAWVTLLQAEYRAGHFERALELEASALGAAQRVGDPWLESEALLFLGGALSARAQLPRARASFEQAVALREKTWGREDRRTAFALSSLGNALAMQGDLEHAIDAHRRSLVAAQAALGPRHPAIGTLRGNLGDDFLYGLDAPAAVVELGGAVELLWANDPTSREAANVSTDLGFAQLLAGRPGDALATFERALASWNQLAPKHPLRGMCLLGHFQASKALGKEAPLEELETALQLTQVLPPFERGRVQLALAEALEQTDAPRAKALMHDAEVGLASTTLPLIAAAHRRAALWLEAHR